jgi:predicted Zn-dependent protease with MMP-like domain
MKAIADHEVATTQDELPDALRALAERVPVLHYHLPTDEILGAEFEPDILGMFVGAPHGEASGETNDVPAQIMLFLGNLWEFAEADPQMFADEVHITYLHELGHYFGWDEDDLAARDLD